MAVIQQTNEWRSLATVTETQAEMWHSWAFCSVLTQAQLWKHIQTPRRYKNEHFITKRVSLIFLWDPEREISGRYICKNNKPFGSCGMCECFLHYCNRPLGRGEGHRGEHLVVLHKYCRLLIALPRGSVGTRPAAEDCWCCTRAERTLDHQGQL